MNVHQLVGWATDGCATMKKAVRDFSIEYTLDVYKLTVTKVFSTSDGN